MILIFFILLCGIFSTVTSFYSDWRRVAYGKNVSMYPYNTIVLVRISFEKKQGFFPDFKGSQCSKVIEDSELLINYCSGVVIYPQYVITSAHCIDHGPKKPKPSAVHIRYGLNPGELDTEIKVANFLEYPDWRANQYDVALLHLTYPVDKINPSMLVSREKWAITWNPERGAQMCGYGDTENGVSMGLKCLVYPTNDDKCKKPVKTDVNM